MSGDILLRKQGEAISASTASRSGRLSAGRRVTVTQSGSTATLSLVHPVYERFLDVRPERGSVRKRRRIHNRFVFGAYNAVAGRLLSGYSREAAAAIKDGAK